MIKGRRAALVAVAVLASTVAGTGRTAWAASSYSVLQINMCNSGRNPDCDKYRGKATTGAADLIMARKPSVVTINEACRSDLAAIKSRTGYDGLFTQAGTETCKKKGDPKDGQAFGNALLFPPGASFGRPSYEKPYGVQSRRVERRMLTCVPAAGVVACVTHLETSGRIAASQAKEINRVVGGFVGRGPTVLGGDWNLTAKKAQRYVPAGMFRKGDNKVQHVMASGRDFRFAGTRIMRLNWTDHPALQVYFTRR